MTTVTRPAAGSVEQRTAATAPTLIDGKRLRGIVPYGVESRELPGGFREVIMPGALAGAKLDDLIATVDHVGIPIGRWPTTLDVEDRADGMHWSVSLPESRADLREAIERGDLRAGSFRMIVKRDEYRGDVRHVHEIAELRDVSIVSQPAYGLRHPREPFSFQELGRPSTRRTHDESSPRTPDRARRPDRRASPRQRRIPGGVANALPGTRARARGG